MGSSRGRTPLPRYWGVASRAALLHTTPVRVPFTSVGGINFPTSRVPKDYYSALPTGEGAGARALVRGVGRVGSCFFKGGSRSRDRGLGFSRESEQTLPFPGNRGGEPVLPISFPPSPKSGYPAPGGPLKKPIHLQPFLLNSTPPRGSVSKYLHCSDR